MDYIKNFKSGKRISEILHDAADRHLSVDYASYTVAGTLASEYSCISILYALIGKNTDVNPRFEDYNDWKKYNPEYKRIMKGLYNLGLKTTGGIGTIFEKLPSNNRQQARYGWLKMAAMMAEEQEQRGEI